MNLLIITFTQLLFQFFTEKLSVYFFNCSLSLVLMLVRGLFASWDESSDLMAMKHFLDCWQGPTYASILESILDFLRNHKCFFSLFFSATKQLDFPQDVSSSFHQVIAVDFGTLTSKGFLLFLLHHLLHLHTHLFNPHNSKQLHLSLNS